MKCQACGVEFVNHPGVSGTCRWLQDALEALRKIKELSSLEDVPYGALGQIRDVARKALKIDTAPLELTPPR